MGFSLGGALKGAISGFVGSGGNPLGAVIGGAGGLLDSYQDKAYYNYAYNKDIALWNMQNEYNLPKNQMQRYRDANLNANLIYGQQNVSDSVGHSTFSQQSDVLGKGSRLANDKMTRMAQYQGIMSNQAAIDETKARIEQIHNNIDIANKMLPYQQKALEMQIKNTEAGLTAPSWISNFIGKDASEKVGAGANWLVNGISDLINSIHYKGKAWR